MAGWQRAALGVLLVLAFANVPAGVVHASGGADCGWLGNCKVHDIIHPKPPKHGGGHTTPGTPVDPGNPDVDGRPGLPDCSSFAGSSADRPTNVADPENWVQVSCLDGGVMTTVWVERTRTAAQIARSLLAQVKLEPIRIGLVPRGADVMTVVGMPVWLWVDEPSRTTWGPATISAGGMTLTAKVQSVTWDMGDGTTLSCGKGTEWKRGMGGDPSPTCGHTYDEQGSYTIWARSHWLARWSGYGQSGTIPVTLSTSRQLDVGEIQVIVTRR